MPISPKLRVYNLKFMKLYIFPIFLLLILGSLSGQSNANKIIPSTLNEISIQGTSVPELDLSRSSILTSDQIKDRQIDNLVDLSALTPNLHINANGIQSYGDIIAIRGIANTQLFGAPGVLLYVDGVPQADVSSYSSTLYDIESVEILRGPQGYHYGKSVTGGAINIKTKAPGKEQSNEISASYGTFDSQKYNLSSKGPLSDGFSYSMAVRRALSEGFLNNSSGADNTSETWHGALKLYLDKGNGTKFSFGANFEIHELGAQPLVMSDPSNFYARSANFDEYTEIDRNQQFLTFESELGEYRLFSVTNRNDWSMNPNRLDLDMSSASISTSVILQDHIEWTQEFRLESEEGSELDWVLGAFYADSEIQGDGTRWFVFEYPTPAPAGNFNNRTEQTKYELNSKSLGLFASISKEVSENDSISAGLRFDNFEKKLSRNKRVQMPAYAPFFYPAQDTTTATLSKKETFSSLSPSLQWEHSFSEGLTGNARVTYAEKPGGFSGYSGTTGKIAFSEEETMSYEISILLNPAENWGLNLTAYLNDIENYQFELPLAGTTDYYVANANEVTAKGLEIEGFFKPAESFTLSVAYGICDSEYDKFDESPNLVGKQVSFVPDHTLSFSLNYQLDNGFYGQIGTKTIGETYFWVQDGDNPGDMIESYTLLDAKLGFDYESWSFDLFGLNLTDEEYYTSKVSNLKAFTGAPPAGGPAPGIAGSPRVIGLSVSKEF